MDEKLNPKDKVLLMRDEGEGNKLKVVKGVNKKGKIDAVDPMKAKQNDFLIIDKHADPIENFFKNFFNQAKNPSHTGFYAVTVDMLDKVLKLSDEELQKCRINPKDYLNKEQEQSAKETQKQTATDEKKESLETKTDQKPEFKQFDTSRIPESEYQKYGIKPENLEGELKAMSYGYKSPHLVDINPNIEGVDYPMKARLSLEEQTDGSLKFVPHPQQQQVDFEKPYQGIILPNDVVERLLATGNGGRAIELEPTPGEKVLSLVSLDKLTNRIEAVALKDINIPQILKNAPLSPEQQHGLKCGIPVWVEGMDKRVKQGEKPQKISRFVQYNAANKNFDFRFSDEQRQQYKERQGQKTGDEQKIPKARKLDDVWVYSKQGGVQLNHEDFNKLCNKEPIFVEGMQSQKPKQQQADASGTQKVETTDNKGQKYNAWVWIDDSRGKVRHTSKHPDEVRAIDAKQAVKNTQNVKPAAESKTQVAVNNHGKTNEATKHSTEPLKKGQTKPTENQDTQQKNKRTAKKRTGQSI